MSDESEQQQRPDDGVAFSWSRRWDLISGRQQIFAEPRGQATNPRVLRKIPVPGARTTTSDLLVKDLFRKVVQSLIQGIQIPNPLSCCIVDPRGESVLVPDHDDPKRDFGAGHIFEEVE